MDTGYQVWLDWTISFVNLSRCPTTKMRALIFVTLSNVYLVSRKLRPRRSFVSVGT